MGDMLLFGNILEEPRVPRKYRERRLTLLDTTDKELRSRYRIGRDSIIRITDLVRDEITHPTERSHSLSAEMQVLVVLRYFATGRFLQVIGDTVGVDKSTVSRCMERVSTALAAKADRFIKWPSIERKREMFFDSGGFPGVVGCVDGTHIRITAPSNDELSFINRKGFHSINTQAICDHEDRYFKTVT